MNKIIYFVLFFPAFASFEFAFSFDVNVVYSVNFYTKHNSSFASSFGHDKKKES